MNLPRYLATHLQGRDALGLQERIDDFRDTIRLSGGRIVDIKWDDRMRQTRRQAIVFYEFEESGPVARGARTPRPMAREAI